MSCFLMDACSIEAVSGVRFLMVRKYAPRGMMLEGLEAEAQEVRRHSPHFV